jgi:hypothetical protein
MIDIPRKESVRMSTTDFTSGGAMRKVFSTTLLALAFAVSASAGAAQESSGAKVQKDKSPAAAAAGTQNPQDKARKRDGNDCSAQRAGVRCSRPKPKNPWFFGS